MRKTKANLWTLIPVFEESSLLSRTVEEALVYSDRIFVTHGRDVSIPDEIEDWAKVTETSLSGTDLRRYGMMQIQRLGLTHHLMDETIVYLEVGQLISEPHLVRPIIELNPGRILMAERFFMWDQEHYRTDGFFYPQYQPVIGPYRNGLRWTNDLFTAPDFMYHDRHLQIDAPFNIQDYRFYNRHDDRQPTLRPYQGTILV